MDEKIIYLVRHALPDYPDGKKMCLGQKLDLPLSREGWHQAQKLADFFAAMKVDAVFSSPLLRARQTAQAIAAGRAPLYPLEGFAELSGGEWDGLTFDAIRALYPDRKTRPACPPGGESDEQGLARALPALDAAAEKTARCAVIVAHGAINSAVLCALSGLPMSEKKRFAQDYAAVSALRRKDGCWQVISPADIRP